jgi:hypothetical protein
MVCPGKELESPRWDASHINIVNIFYGCPVVSQTYEYQLHTWHNIYDLYTVNYTNWQIAHDDEFSCFDLLV